MFGELLPHVACDKFCSSFRLVTRPRAPSCAQADTYVSVLGGPTFAPALRVGGSKFDMDTGFNVGARVGTSLERWNLPNFR